MRELYFESTRKTLAIVAIGIAAAISFSLWQKMSSFISAGFDSSKKIRLNGNSFCIVSQKDAPHFSGCNSIL